MSEETLIKSNEDLEIIPDKASQAFIVPTRNWNNLVENFNRLNKKKFPFTALQCKSIIEYVKRGIPPQQIFKGLGYSKAKYGTLLQGGTELEEEFQLLVSKEDFTEEEAEKLQVLMQHPLRILMGDLIRAEGVSDILLWEAFNEKATGKIINTDILLTLMKAKFKEVFSEKPSEHGSVNIEVKIGGAEKWIETI